MKYKLACVTGASSGIGRATAEILASRGGNILLLARRLERLEELKMKLTKMGATVFTFPLDLSDRGEIEKFVAEQRSLIEKVDLLVNNAGLARGREPFQECSMDDWDQMIDTNVKGLLFLTRAIVPHMIKNDFGHIVNVGSVAGRWTYPNGAVYCATKAAVRAISESLRLDLMGSKIRVTVVEPGMVETEFSTVRYGDAEKAKAIYKGMQPLTAVDIAESIVWCAERPAHVNIQELVIFPTAQAGIQNVHRRV